MAVTFTAIYQASDNKVLVEWAVDQSDLTAADVHPNENAQVWAPGFGIVNQGGNPISSGSYLINHNFCPVDFTVELRSTVYQQPGNLHIFASLQWPDDVELPPEEETEYTLTPNVPDLLVVVDWSVPQSELDVYSVDGNDQATLIQQGTDNIYPLPSGISGGTANVLEDIFPDGAIVNLTGPHSVNGNPVIFAGAPWPTMAPPPPPAEPTFTEWVQIAATLPGLTGPFVTGFRIEQTLQLLEWFWNRYAGAIEYQLQARNSSTETFFLLATVPQSANPEISLELPDWQDDPRFVPGALMIYRLRARLT